jgi:hypothetical protein
MAVVSFGSRSLLSNGSRNHSTVLFSCYIIQMCYFVPYFLKFDSVFEYTVTLFPQLPRVWECIHICPKKIGQFLRMNFVKSLSVFSLLVLPYQGFSFQFCSSCFSILNDVLYV